MWENKPGRKVHTMDLYDCTFRLYNKKMDSKPLHVDLGLNNSGTFCYGFSFEHIKSLLERLALEYAVNLSCLLSLLLCFHRLESPNHRVSKTSNSVKQPLGPVYVIGFPGKESYYRRKQIL